MGSVSEAWFLQVRGYLGLAKLDSVGTPHHVALADLAL